MIYLIPYDERYKKIDQFVSYHTLLIIQKLKVGVTGGSSCDTLRVAKWMDFNTEINVKARVNGGSSCDTLNVAKWIDF